MNSNEEEKIKGGSSTSPTGGTAPNDFLAKVAQRRKEQREKILGKSTGSFTDSSAARTSTRISSGTSGLTRIPNLSARISTSAQSLFEPRSTATSELGDTTSEARFRSGRQTGPIAPSSSPSPATSTSPAGSTGAFSSPHAPSAPQSSSPFRPSFGSSHPSLKSPGTGLGTGPSFASTQSSSSVGQSTGQTSTISATEQTLDRPLDLSSQAFDQVRPSNYPNAGKNGQSESTLILEEDEAEALKQASAEELSQAAESLFGTPSESQYKPKFQSQASFAPPTSSTTSQPQSTATASSNDQTFNPLASRQKRSSGFGFGGTQTGSSGRFGNVANQAPTGASQPAPAVATEMATDQLHTDNRTTADTFPPIEDPALQSGAQQRSAAWTSPVNSLGDSPSFGVDEAIEQGLGAQYSDVAQTPFATSQSPAQAASQAQFADSHAPFGQSQAPFLNSAAPHLNSGPPGSRRSAHTMAPVDTSVPVTQAVDPHSVGDGQEGFGSDPNQVQPAYAGQPAQPAPHMGQQPHPAQTGYPGNQTYPAGPTNYDSGQNTGYDPGYGQQPGGNAPYSPNPTPMYDDYSDYNESNDLKGGFPIPVIIGIALLLAAVGGFAYYVFKMPKPPKEEAVAEAPVEDEEDKLDPRYVLTELRAGEPNVRWLVNGRVPIAQDGNEVALLKSTENIVTALKDGFEPSNRVVIGGTPNDLRIPLDADKPGPKAMLKFEVDPPGANVILNGVTLGGAPVGQGNLSMNYPAHVEISEKGYGTYVGFITPSTQDQIVKVILRKEPIERTEVILKVGGEGDEVDLNGKPVPGTSIQSASTDEMLRMEKNGLTVFPIDLSVSTEGLGTVEFNMPIKEDPRPKGILTLDAEPAGTEVVIDNHIFKKPLEKAQVVAGTLPILLKKDGVQVSLDLTISPYFENKYVVELKDGKARVKSRKRLKLVDEKSKKIKISDLDDLFETP